MNHSEEITPEYAERLVALLGMMGDLGRDSLDDRVKFKPPGEKP